MGNIFFLQKYSDHNLDVRFTKIYCSCVSKLAVGLLVSRSDDNCTKDEDSEVKAVVVWVCNNWTGLWVVLEYGDSAPVLDEAPLHCPCLLYTSRCV